MFIATCRSHPESHSRRAATSRCADALGRAMLLPRVRAALKMPWSNMRPFVPNIKKPTARNIRKTLIKSDVSDFCSISTKESALPHKTGDKADCRELVSDELADDVHLLNQVGCSAELITPITFL